MLYSNFRVIARRQGHPDIVLFKGSPQECLDFLCDLEEPSDGWQYGLAFTQHHDCCDCEQE